MRRRFADKEIASVGNDPYSYNLTPAWGKTRLARKDRFLVETGGNSSEALDLYLDLATDSQVFAAWDRQMSEIISRELIVEPASKEAIDEEIAAYIKDKLENLSVNEQEISHDELAIVGNGCGIDELTRGLGLSTITGVAFAEIIWMYDAKKKADIAAVKIRDPRRFHFELKNGLTYVKLLTRKYSYDGIYLPPRKFIINRFWSLPNDDPYGFGLGRLLYYPVAWKRELLSLWLKIVDKHSDPTVVGTYDEDVEEEVLEEFQRAISSLSRDLSMTMPSLFKVDFLSPNLTTSELLETLEKNCNSYINKIINGESNTGEQGAGGVLRENISNSIRIMKAKTVSDLISNTINNTLVKWVVNYRWPGAKLPKVWRNFEDAQEIIELLTKMKGLGFTTDQTFVEDLTDIPLQSIQKKSFA